MNEWLVSSFLKGPCHNAAGLGSVDHQWGHTMGLRRRCAFVDSPSRVGSAAAGDNFVMLCLWRWNGEVVGIGGCAFPWRSIVDLGRMAVRIGQGYLVGVGCT